MTLVCVPIMVQDVHSALADAAAARDHGADLVEFRVDEFFTGAGFEDAAETAGATPETRDLLRLVAQSPLPCIVTCRAAAEGGAYAGDEAARVSLYERLGTAAGHGEHPPRYLDVELDSYTRSANVKQKINLAVRHGGHSRDLATGLILSSHDFQGRPADLLRRVTRMQNEPAAAVLKVAFRARSLRDTLELLDLPSQTGRPTIALGMGEFGLPSRVLAPKFGGFLTFASLRESAATAPGQPTIRQLLDGYRFRSISASTGVYGVIGWPVAHSKSPLIHNAGFEAIGHRAVYLPLPIAAPDDAEGAFLSLKATLPELIDHPRLDLRGASVTIPHKEGLVRLGRELGWSIDAASLAVGAANTVIVDRAVSSPGRPGVRIANTDAPALASVIRDASTPGTRPGRGRRVAILGAGGVARAAVWALAHEADPDHATESITVYSRDEARGRAMVDSIPVPPRVRLVWAPWSHRERACADVIVNCTPVGMAHGPAPDAAPVDVPSMNACGSDPLVVDTVYTPALTPLLRAARARGWRTADGVAMFLRQAALQFESWTGRPAPVGVFERALSDDAADARR